MLYIYNIIINSSSVRRAQTIMTLYLSLIFMVLTNSQLSATGCQVQVISEMKRQISHCHFHGENCHLHSPCLGRLF